MPATSYYAPNQQCVHSDCSGPARSTEGNGGTMAVDGTGVTGCAMGPEGFSIQSTQTSPSSFTFGTPSPDPPPANPPTLTAISPTVTNAGAGQFGVTIYGTDFQNDMVGVTAARPEIATTFIDTETAGIMLDTTVDVVAGQISFYVVNPDGQRSSESLAVEIVPDPPYIDTVTPNMWNAYTLQQLVIAGTGFVVESTAWLEDSATHMTELTMLSQDATTITCRYEGGAASSGPGQVTVKNSETAFSNGVNVLLTSG